MNRYEIGWLAYLAIGSFYEIWNNFHGKPTLTDFAMKFLPWFLIMPVMSWAWLHFASNYKFPEWLLKIFRG